jgi:Domain of unknown function (DUF1906)
MLRKILAASFLVCSFSASSWADKKPSDYPNHVPLCQADPADVVADFSIPVNALSVDKKPVYDVLRSFGVKTIIRYYDFDDESLPCKTLLNDEAKSIMDNGFQIAVVFQHNNGSPSTFFSEKRGKEDAERALELAKHNGQPPNTTIFFGVDGPDNVIDGAVLMYKLAHGGPISPELAKKHKWDSADIKQYNYLSKYGPKMFGRPDLGHAQPADILPYVEKYFERVASVFKASADAGGPSYKVGVYGSGLVCERLSKRHDIINVDCWLAQSVGWPNYDSFRANGNWSLLQKNPTYCETWVNVRQKKHVGPLPQKEQPGFDFNLVRPGKADFGQWTSKLDGTIDFKRPKDCPLLAPLPVRVEPRR